jgi:hypothetical protein
MLVHAELIYEHVGLGLALENFNRRARGVFRSAPITKRGGTGRCFHELHIAADTQAGFSC